MYNSFLPMDVCSPTYQLNEIKIRLEEHIESRIPRLFLNQKVHCRVYRSRRLNLIRIHLTPFHTPALFPYKPF